MELWCLLIGGFLSTAFSTIDRGLILRYDFSTSSSRATVADGSDNARAGILHGSPTFDGGALTFDGQDDYIELPHNLLGRVRNFTVEMEVLIDSDQQTPYFIFGLGNTASNAGSGYVFTTGNPYRASIAARDWSTEQTVSSGSDLARDRWMHLAYTLAEETARLYLDGAEVSRLSGIAVEPGDIGRGSTSANYIGRSMYTSDKLFKGRMRHFALYERALDAKEIFLLSGNAAAISEVAISDPDVLKTNPVVDLEARSVIFPVKLGTDTTHLTPIFTTADGVIAIPPSGAVADLSTAETYTLTQGETTIARWTMKAIEMRSPVLPGYYADPNIAIFDNLYYIYATSDGFPGWGGDAFYVWKSPNLVNWTRSSNPFLVLDRTKGTVPWATGNAWAPTIIARNGTYYFYFSGQNPTYNRKTIGVAVAASPDGPFTAQPTAMVLNNEAVTSGQAIDPCAFKDPKTGRHYLFWGNGKPVYAELSDDMLSIKKGTLRAISGLTNFREGTFVNYRSGLYHLTYSIDDTGSENYRVGSATATSVDGPWSYRGIVLEKNPSLGILATGHNSIVSIPGTDEWYIAYHRFRIPGGDGTHRETTIDRLEFDESGFIRKVVPTLESVEARLIP